MISMSLLAQLGVAIWGSVITWQPGLAVTCAATDLWTSSQALLIAAWCFYGLLFSLTCCICCCCLCCVTSAAAAEVLKHDE